jgi:hypothetical protein
VSGRPRRTAAVLLIVLLLAAPGQADIIPDPIESGLLAKIVAALQAIEQLRLQMLDGIQVQIYNRLRGVAFPSLLFDPIRMTIASVVDIRRELQRLSCNWSLSPRTLALREMLLRRLTFCRSGHQDVWGTHERFWDGPIQEVNDYVATMTANMISERTHRTNTTWVRAHADLFDGHTIMRNSPGEANRAEAAALAYANQVANGNSQVVTQNLLVRQMARDLERFDQKKAADLSHYTYRGLSTLAGGDGRTPPRDPADGIGQ